MADSVLYPQIELVVGRECSDSTDVQPVHSVQIESAIGRECSDSCGLCTVSRLSQQSARNAGRAQ